MAVARKVRREATIHRSTRSPVKKSSSRATKLPTIARTPKPGKSRQHAHLGGSFDSERQRRFLWARYPKAARKWAHNVTTQKGDWKPMPGWNRKGSTYRWRIDGRRKAATRRRKSRLVKRGS